MYDIAYIIVAVFLFIIANFIRHYRWTMFSIIKEDSNINLYNGTLYIAISNLLNLILPLKLSEFFRAFMLYKKSTKYSFIYILSSLIWERLTDIIIIMIIFLGLYYFGFINYYNFTAAITITTILVIVAGLVLFKPNVINQIIYKILSIFNSNIKVFILTSIYENYIFLNNIAKNIIVYTVLTVCLYSFYLLSIWCFILYAYDVSFLTIFTELYSIRSFGLSYIITNITGDKFISSILSYLLMVNFSLIVCCLIFKKINIPLFYNKNNNLAVLPFSPQVLPEYISMFYNKNKKEQFYKIIKINYNTQIIKDISGGSEATTLLIDINNKLTIRKIAFHKAAIIKLKEQYIWLKEHTQGLPLCKIGEFNEKNHTGYYDMPYSHDSISFFDFIHTSSHAENSNLLKKILSDLKNFHIKYEYTPSKEVLLHFYQEKYEKIIDDILQKSYLKEITAHKSLIINDVPYYNLNDCYKIINFSIFQNLLNNTKVTITHGDFTVENIICKQEKLLPNKRYFLIDPNPNNIFNSQFIDYGKLRQSLGCGYEFLMQHHHQVKVQNNHINFVDTKSHKYIELLTTFDEFLEKNFSTTGIQLTMLFEIIAYVRLVPYKYKKDKKTAIPYVAVLIILMNDFINKFYPNAINTINQDT